jgi:phage terminase Nu1 subunit (DNA packaging protein)
LLAETAFTFSNIKVDQIMIVTRQTLSECLNISTNRVSQLVRDGMPKEARGKYDLAECVRWYLGFKLKSGPHSTANVNEARQALYEAQTEKVALETARIRKETVAADQYMIDLNQMAVLFSSGLDSIGGRLASQLAGMTDPAEIAAHLTHETNAIRESVADAIAMYASTVSHE